MIKSAAFLAFLALGASAVSAAQFDVRHVGEDLSSMEDSIFDSTAMDEKTMGNDDPTLYLPACGTLQVQHSLAIWLNLAVCTGKPGDTRDDDSVYVCGKEKGKPALLKFFPKDKGYIAEIYYNPDNAKDPTYGTGWYLGASGELESDFTKNSERYKVIARKGVQNAAVWSKVEEAGGQKFYLMHNPDKTGITAVGGWIATPIAKRDDDVRGNNPMSAYFTLTKDKAVASTVSVKGADCK